MPTLTGAPLKQKLINVQVTFDLSHVLLTEARSDCKSIGSTCHQTFKQVLRQTWVVLSSGVETVHDPVNDPIHNPGFTFTRSH